MASVSISGRYCAFDLSVESEVPLSEWQNSQHASAPDVVVRFGDVQGTPTATTSLGTAFRVDENSATLFYSDIGAFAVRAGTEIVVQPSNGAVGTMLELFVTGPAIGLLLHQRGCLVLHASAVRIGDCAVLFLGATGAGKSTLAAVLNTRGYAVVADDIVAFDGSGVHTAGCRSLRLWPDSLGTLDVDPTSLESVHPAISKKRWKAVDRPVAPVRRLLVFELVRESRPRTDAVDAESAFHILLAHSYAAPLFFSNGLGAAHLTHCAALAKSGAVRRLCIGDALEDLQSVAALVETDVTEQRPA